jgi:hypothetical protein
MNNMEILKQHKREKEGLCFINKYGESYVVVEYKNAKNVLILFNNGYKYRIEWKQITKGTAHSPYAKTVYNVGYIGEGKYKPYIKKGEMSLEYKVWDGILRRCYNEKEMHKHPTYKDVVLESELHNFQNFAEWFNNNYYEVPNDRMELDKDILCKGNKVYSKETMIFVPRRINILFTKNDINRGKYPIGVCEHNGKLNVQCSILDNGKKKRKHLGSFSLDKPFQAFTLYKNFKESYVKKVADEYKELIPKKLYDTLYNYKVEIND